ncbi:class I SAM-dependent methyltransferase [Candidatus Zixiibacteriota bacterium]
MSELDDLARRNRQAWEKDVQQNGPYTVPWLDLEPNVLRAFAKGEIETLPEPYVYIYPPEILRNLAGKDVLCLASGGGQQSVVFGLLGAKLTAWDLTEGQLAGDRRAAEHYGYEIKTIPGDMRDLSGITPESFDLVYQAISMCFVPDVRQVYREVARVLRPGGLYRVGHINPGTYLVDEDSWDGAAYHIAGPYFGGQLPEEEQDGFSEFRHHLSDVFNGLIDAGFTIEGVWEDPRHLQHDPQAQPGTDRHLLNSVQKFFCILVRKK